jgi:hypothetical protein
MSIELVGFENLPNAYIKEVALYEYSDTEMEAKVTVCIHDLGDGSIWSDTSEFLAQFLKISVLFSEDPRESQLINTGNIDISTLKGVQSKSIKEPMKTEDSLIYQYAFSHITKKVPSHLNVYAFCQVSKEQILENLGIMIPKSYLGPIKAERIYKESALAENTFAFVRNNGEYWSGPVHQAEDGKYMIGSHHTNTYHESLRRIIVKNTKIKDMRDTKHSYEKHSTDVSNFISDLQVSYNSDTDINALFMLNIKSILKQKTKYGSFLERASSPVISQIINNFSIKLMTIERMRVKTNKQSGTLRSPSQKAQKVYSKKMICKSYDQNGVLKNMTRLERRGMFDVVESELRSNAGEPNRKTSEIFKEQLSDYKKISKITELFFDYGEEIRTFQFNDYEMTDRTPGEYQYKTSISFIDPIDSFLRQVTKAMKEDISKIKSYTGYASRMRDLTSTNVNYQRLVESYIKHYSYVYELTDREKVNMTSRKLNLLSPSTATLESIKKFEKEYKVLYSEFISFLDYDPEIAMRRNTLVSIKAKDSATGRVVIDKTFDKIVKPSRNKYGFGYMGEGKMDSMRMFSRREYQDRIQQETKSNYVEEPNVSSPDLPEGVNSGLRDISTFSTAYIAPIFGKLNSSTVGMKLDRSTPFDRINMIINGARGAQKTGKTAMRTTSPAGITTKPPSVPTQEPTTEGEEPFVDASKIIGSSHEFVTYSEMKDSYNIVDKQTDSGIKVNNSLSGYTNNRTFDITIDNTKLLSAAEATALPNQLKAVIGGTTSATRNEYITTAGDLLAQPTTKNYYEVNNFSVQQVAYVDGFMHDTNGNIMLNKPVYKLMSLDNFSTLDKPVLCFLQAYTNNKFNITDESATSVLDSVFVLSDKDITKTPDRASIQSQPNYNIQDLGYTEMRSEIVIQTNQPVTVGISQTNASDETTQASNVPLVPINTNLFGSY